MKVQNICSSTTHTPNSYFSLGNTLVHLHIVYLPTYLPTYLPVVLLYIHCRTLNAVGKAQVHKYNVLYFNGCDRDCNNGSLNNFFSSSIHAT